MTGETATRTVRRKLLLLGLAFLVTAAAAVCSGWRILDVIDQPSQTATYSLRVGGLDRSYTVTTPSAGLPESAPVIIVLQGKASTIPQETRRDHLVPYVDSRQAELVYPAAYHESWNAGGCCGKASQLHIDDVGFLKALIPAVDPGHRHPLYLVGYSNGGRLAYRMACDYPGTFTTMAVVMADPEPGCVVPGPLNILQVDARDDTFIPYQPGDKGTESPPAVEQSARLRQAGRCPGTGTATRHGAMSLTTWDACAAGTRYWFAVYDTGGHAFPQPAAKTPAAAQVIWSFFTKTPLAPLPS